MEDFTQWNCAVNSYQQWQANYAAHGVATFPVDANKRPMVSRYDRFGLVGSAKIASKFGHAPAIGFMCGKRNGITVLDVDCKDERVLADAARSARQVRRRRPQRQRQFSSLVQTQ